MPRRRPIHHPFRSRPRGTVAAALALTALAGCGGAVAAGENTSTSGYAATPAAAGAVNPQAIPLGDGYRSSTPKVGYVDSCQTSFATNEGSQVDGPWIDTANHTWNEDTKLAVSGKVAWPNAAYSVTTSGSRRVIRFNDLPTDHTTGTFPIASSDPVYKYDFNPNHISAQSLDWKLALNPAAARTPGCLNGGAIGVLNDGVALYDALDGEGRDAGAHEVLDACGGHPDQSFEYHHHDVPACISGSVKPGHSKLVGYALDGYGIYVVKNRNGSLPTNTDLDRCHGTTSRVMWNGRMQRIYHYVATLEYPYTLGCFHGTPISTGTSRPGGAATTGASGPSGTGPSGASGPSGTAGPIPGRPGAPA